MTAKAKTTAENLEARFDAGEDVLDYFDLTRARRPGQEKVRVNLDLAKHMVEDLERVAGQRGVSRQTLMKKWLAERLAREKATA